MKSKFLLAGAMLAFAVAASPANAVTLLDLINAPGQTNTPYALTFTATTASVTLSVAGYQVPSAENATQNAVRLGAGPNLLGTVWTYTPAASGALADQYNDGFGTGTNGLIFAGVTTGSYDIFSQTFATTIGSTYTYNFLYSNSGFNSPSGFRVDVDGANAGGVVPEPAAWALMIGGFGMVGGAMRRRATRTTVRFA